MARYLYEVVALTQDCELGKLGERALVVDLEGETRNGKWRWMTLVFFNRARADRVVHTGCDYRFIETVEGSWPA